MKFIYNKKPRDDVKNILRYLEGFSKDNEINISIDPNKLELACKNLRVDFPHRDGVDKASVFKKAASFILYGCMNASP